jgi:hypothetical protein
MKIGSAIGLGVLILAAVGAAAQIDTVCTTYDYEETACDDAPNTGCS